MSKVYVTQEVFSADYGDAQRYGDVVFLTASEVSMASQSLHNVKLVEQIRRGLSKYDPEVDFVAPSGSPIITGLVFAILAEKTSRMNILKWNGRDQRYASVTISTKGQGNV